MSHAFRFLHAADLHLDSPFRGLVSLPEPIRGLVRESTFAALGNLVRTAIAERVDFVVLAGDIYDTAERSLRAQLKFRRATEQLAERGIAVYVVHGNHDPDDGSKAKLDWPDSVHTFSSAEVECVPAFDRHGRLVAHVCGRSYPTAAVADDWSADYKVARGDVFHIGLLHANVDGDADHGNYAPCTRRQLAASGFHYWALGHIHTRRTLHEDPWIVYPGNTQGRSVRECGPKGCYVVDVTAAGRVSMRFHPTDALRWFCESVTIDTLKTEQELRDAFAAALERCRELAEGRPSFVRLDVEGRGPLHHALSRGSALQELVDDIREEEARRAETDASDFVWVESVRLATGAEIDRESILGEQSFRGDMLRYAAALREDRERARSFCEVALAPLLAHPKAGRLVAEMLREETDDLLRAAEELALGWIADEEAEGFGA
jgi:DNA repair exonuclease SbcCD nuclease subunit